MAPRNNRKQNYSSYTPEFNDALFYVHHVEVFQVIFDKLS